MLNDFPLYPDRLNNQVLTGKMRNNGSDMKLIKGTIT